MNSKLRDQKLVSLFNVVFTPEKYLMSHIERLSKYKKVLPRQMIG